MALPLRIFEERYKVMMRELLAGDRRFGVLLIKEGQELGGGAVPFEVGTTAYVEQWEELQGGRYALSAKGERRFRLVRMLEPRPYPYGEIELIDTDYRGDEARLRRGLETVRATFPAYFRLALSLTDQWARGLKLPADAHDVVDFLGPWLQVDEEVKQRLIEIEAASDRVGYLAEVLDDLLSRTQSEVTEYRRKKFDSLGGRN
jgi:Lon protease-like protein